jgi:23S rRNA pseudouridine2605 synthase
VRLAKFLAHSGVASRRAAEQLIRAGRVTVGREVVTDPARDVDETSQVGVDGEAVEPESLEVHMLNKPAGVVSTAKDTHGRRTVTQLVPSRRRLYPVGRLDADTTGLILLTNDGELANRLTHPRYGVPRTYLARVGGAAVSEAALRRLRQGVEIEGGPTQPAKVRRIEANLIELTIKEGRKHQVKLMCEAVGHPVAELSRIAFGPLRLDDLGPGRHRRLTAAETERLRQSPA